MNSETVKVIDSRPHETSSSEEAETNIKVLESRPNDTEISTSTTGKTSWVKAHIYDEYTSRKVRV